VDLSAQLARDSWTAPVDAAGLHPLDHHNQAAVSQIRALVNRPPARDQAVPLCVFDAGYDPCALSLGLAEVPAAILVRLALRALLLRRPATACSGRQGGRPRRHGAKLDTTNPASWPVPTSSHTEDDGHYGTVTVQAWAGLHPKQQLHPTRGTTRPGRSCAAPWSVCRSSPRGPARRSAVAVVGRPWPA
jgi:hypothetical protein